MDFGEIKLIYYSISIKIYLKNAIGLCGGGDYYFPEKQSWMRHKVIKNIGNNISATKYDIDYIKNKYQIKSNNIFFSQCYPTCISDFERSIYKKENNKTLKILVGNSAPEVLVICLNVTGAALRLAINNSALPSPFVPSGLSRESKVI